MIDTHAHTHVEKSIFAVYSTSEHPLIDAILTRVQESLLAEQRFEAERRLAKQKLMESLEGIYTEAEVSQNDRPKQYQHASIYGADGTNMYPFMVLMRSIFRSAQAGRSRGQSGNSPGRGKGR